MLTATKRELCVKDWDAMIEGHGGMPERMASVTFAVPAFFPVTRFYFWP